MCDDRHDRPGWLHGPIRPVRCVSAVAVTFLTGIAAPSPVLRIMQLKGTKLYSILRFKCPQCHEGDFFVAHPYNISKVGDTPERCPVCGLKYEKEPGFFQGAMYVSYAIGVAVSVATWVAVIVLFPDMGPTGQILAITGVMLLGSPYFYTLSKALWANMFFHYKKPDHKVV